MIHPWKDLLIEIKGRNWTQKYFSLLLWKKVSEVNELIKWKRNVTIQRDLLLSNVLWSEERYRLWKQIDYDYDIAKKEFKFTPIKAEKTPKISEKKLKLDSLSKWKIKENNQNKEIKETIEPEKDIQKDTKIVKQKSIEEDNKTNFENKTANKAENKIEDKIEKEDGIDDSYLMIRIAEISIVTSVQDASWGYKGWPKSVQFVPSILISTYDLSKLDSTYAYLQ